MKPHRKWLTDFLFDSFEIILIRSKQLNKTLFVSLFSSEKQLITLLRLHEDMSKAINCERFLFCLRIKQRMRSHVMIYT